MLGLAEVPKWPHLAARGGVWFEAGSLKFYLGVEKGFGPAKKAHPALLVEDLDEIIKECKGAGYEEVSAEPLGGYHRVYVNDPLGNRIKLTEQV